MIPETPDQIERQVDRHELDMGQRVEHGDARAFGPHLAAPGHFGRR